MFHTGLQMSKLEREQSIQKQVRKKLKISPSEGELKGIITRNRKA